MSDQSCMPFLTLPPRSKKPRKNGINIMSDRSIPEPVLSGFLDAAGDMVDHIKFTDHVGLISRHSPEWMKRRIALYKSYGIPSLPGGVPFEFSVLQGKEREYFATVKELGFDAVEISEDLIPAMSLEKRGKTIRMALDAGLEVFTEVGKKLPEAPLQFEDAVEFVRFDLASGVKKVVIEKADVALAKAGDPSTMIKLAEAVGLENLVYECGPGDFPALAVWLINQFGPEVNLENMYLDEVVHIDGFRQGIGRAVEFWAVTGKMPGGK